MELDKNFKQLLFLKELDHIQNIINRMSTLGNSIRVALIPSSLVALNVLKIGNIKFLFVLFSILALLLVYWFFDIYFSNLERNFKSLYYYKIDKRLKENNYDNLMDLNYKLADCNEENYFKTFVSDGISLYYLFLLLFLLTGVFFFYIAR